jgi:enoyl-CoA hydratase/carnithine racemase
VTLNRSKALNSLNMALIIAELNEALRLIDAQTRRSVGFCSAGLEKAFAGEHVCVYDVRVYGMEG